MYIANHTNPDFQHTMVKSVQPTHSQSARKELRQELLSGIEYWGMWLDADLYYAAFTNSLATSLACSAPLCNLGDYCFNVTNGEGVPTDFQVYAVFDNGTAQFFDAYDLSVRLSSNKYKLIVQLTTNYTTTVCPLQSSTSESPPTACQYGQTCMVTCSNDVSIGFTLAQPSVNYDTNGDEMWL